MLDYNCLFWKSCAIPAVFTYAQQLACENFHLHVKHFFGCAPILHCQIPLVFTAKWTQYIVAFEQAKKCWKRTPGHRLPIWQSSVNHFQLMIAKPQCAKITWLPPTLRISWQNGKMKANANDKMNEWQEHQDEDDSIFLEEIKSQNNKPHKPPNLWHAIHSVAHSLGIGCGRQYCRTMR